MIASEWAVDSLAHTQKKECATKRTNYHEEHLLQGFPLCTFVPFVVNFFL